MQFAYPPTLACLVAASPFSTGARKLRAIPEGDNCEEEGAAFSDDFERTEPGTAQAARVDEPNAKPGFHDDDLGKFATRTPHHRACRCSAAFTLRRAA